MNQMVERAAEIARVAHAGQVDKAGADYITHPARVAGRLIGDATAEAAGWLHDVVEDTGVTLADLAAEFPQSVVSAVDAVTRRPSEAPDAYYARVRSDAVAKRVKAADLADNSDPIRLEQLDTATRTRLQAKYAHARAQLEPHDPAQA